MRNINEFLNNKSNTGLINESKFDRLWDGETDSQADVFKTYTQYKISKSTANKIDEFFGNEVQNCDDICLDNYNFNDYADALDYWYSLQQNTLWDAYTCPEELGESLDKLIEKLSARDKGDVEGFVNAMWSGFCYDMASDIYEDDF